MWVRNDKRFKRKVRIVNFNHNKYSNSDKISIVKILLLGCLLEKMQQKN